MLNRNKIIAALPTLILGTLTMGSIVINVVTYDDDSTPEAAAVADGGGAPRRNPAGTACQQRADGQELPPADTRHEFVRDCLKFAKVAARAASPAPKMP